MVIFPVDDLWGKVDQPIALLEALALGTPVVVLGQGPLKDVEGALQVATLDTQAWIDAIVPLIENSERRAQAIGEGRERVSRVYAAGVVARAYEAIYLRALKQRRA
jgi:phosphatidylinositol alpha-1,6-mannosyltransferase